MNGVKKMNIKHNFKVNRIECLDCSLKSTIDMDLTLFIKRLREGLTCARCGKKYITIK